MLTWHYFNIFYFESILMTMASLKIVWPFKVELFLNDECNKIPYVVSDLCIGYIMICKW